MSDHVCDENCSWMQTPATLKARGYDVEIPARDATVPEKIRAGQTFSKARHQAWENGEIRLCTKRQSNV